MVVVGGGGNSRALLSVCFSRNGKLLHLNSKNPWGSEIIEIRETDSVAVFT